MWGGEIKTGKQRLPAGTKLYHTNMRNDKKLKYFTDFGIPYSTCFFIDTRTTSGHTYMITLLADRVVEVFGDGEVRMNPTKETCKVEYCGIAWKQIENPIEIPIYEE